MAFVGYLAHFWHALGTDKALAAGVALAAIWILTGVNTLGVRQGGVVKVVTTVIKLVPLLMVAVGGLFFVHAHNFGPFNASGQNAFGAVTGAAALTLWAFIGLESATVPAEDVRDPERTIPRATIAGTIVTAIIYILGTVAVLGILPASALAGLFPKVFARTGRGGTPIVGLVVSSTLVTVLMTMNYNASLVDQFTFVILLATLTTLIPYAYASVAQLVLLAPTVPPSRAAGWPRTPSSPCSPSGTRSGRWPGLAMRSCSKGRCCCSAACRSTPG